MVQYYDIDVIKEFAIRGNAALMKCQIPSFVADFVAVVSWHTDQNEDFYPLANQDGNFFKRKLKSYSSIVTITDSLQEFLRVLIFGTLNGTIP